MLEFDEILFDLDVNCFGIFCMLDVEIISGYMDVIYVGGLFFMSGLIFINCDISVSCDIDIFFDYSSLIVVIFGELVEILIKVRDNDNFIVVIFELEWFDFEIVYIDVYGGLNFDIKGLLLIFNVNIFLNII